MLLDDGSGLVTINAVSHIIIITTSSVNANKPKEYRLLRYDAMQSTDTYEERTAPVSVPKSKPSRQEEGSLPYPPRLLLAWLNVLLKIEEVRSSETPVNF
jgi:hypothetical protein